MTNFTIHTDGGARGNPGPAAIGVVIKDDTSGIVTKVGKYIGITTNNTAEYTALIEALKEAQNQNANEIECVLDSELVVKQLNGQYKVKDKNLAKLWLEVKNLQKSFSKVVFKHVPREQNKEADRVVNEVLDFTIKNG